MVLDSYIKEKEQNVIKIFEKMKKLWYYIIDDYNRFCFIKKWEENEKNLIFLKNISWIFFNSENWKEALLIFWE